MTSLPPLAYSGPPPGGRALLGAEAAKAYLDRTVAGRPDLAKSLVGMRISTEIGPACPPSYGNAIPGLLVLTIRLRHPRIRQGDIFFDVAVLPDCWEPARLATVVASVLSTYFHRIALECLAGCDGHEELGG